MLIFGNDIFFLSCNQTSFCASLLTFLQHDKEEVPSKRMSSWGWLQADQPFILPHEWFAAVHANYPGAFKKRICPSHDVLNDFWDQMADHPMMDGHPMTSEISWKRRAVQFALQGDGVPATGVGKPWTQSSEALSWCSLVGRGTDLQCLFYIYGCFKHVASNAPAGHTWRTVWRVVAWSLLWMLRGEWPSHDFMGVAYPPLSPAGKRALKPLAVVGGQKMFAVLWVVKGDLEWVWERLELANYRALSAGRQPQLQTV